MKSIFSVILQIFFLCDLSFVRLPAFYGHFLLKKLVALQNRFYCAVIHSAKSSSTWRLNNCEHDVRNYLFLMEIAAVYCLSDQYSILINSPLLPQQLTN